MARDVQDIFQKVYDGDFLTDRKKEVLQLRLDGVTLEEIGKKFNVSGERVRQLLGAIEIAFIRHLSREEAADGIEFLRGTPRSRARRVSRLDLDIEGGPGYGRMLEEVRKQYPRAYLPWNRKEDKLLLHAVVHFLEVDSREGKTYAAFVKEYAVRFGRKPGAVRSRVRKLLEGGT